MVVLKLTILTKLEIISISTFLKLFLGIVILLLFNANCAYSSDLLWINLITAVSGIISV
jgi:hypothetical protein